MSRSYDALVVDDLGVLSGVPDEDAAVMTDVVRRARAAGLRTGLLSNAYGPARPEWAGLFDAVVLSGVEGVAKPDGKAYRLVAQRLDTAPERCVFVDDLRRNVLGAAAVGMTGVHHIAAVDTLAELEVLIFAV